MLLAAGMSIRDAAGHLGYSDPAFTLRVYTHLLPSSDRRARRVFDDLFEHGLDGPDGLTTV
ncbi:hypothetical protein OHA21_16275 [Actinoplanes sp. NBC_00393]|uniref:hypothetical protein n=1 Tax=Actinoplanes sp. NBC_00393 TaxID=2975953 RepID=UPI002E22711C